MSRTPSLQFRRPKRVLTVRMLVARIAWLDGRLRWHEGRVVWEGPGGRTAPGAADLARAQRCLYKLRSYPYASAAALGDSQAWLEARQARLDLAKQLCALSAADLPALAQQARQGRARAVEHLVRLLTAEALCANPMPIAPSAVLLACGERAAAPLQCLAEDQSMPRAGRALAALTLGALDRAGVPHKTRTSPSPTGDPWLRRAYTWGLRSGLPLEPGLIVTLLVGEAGPDLARRCIAALQPTNPFSLPAELLRELLSERVSPTRVVELAEAAAAAAPLARRILQRPSEPAERPSSRRRTPAEDLLPQRQQTVSALADLLQQYGRATGDPVVVIQMVQLTHALLELGPLTPDLSEGILQVLRAGLKLSPELERPYLELLLERQSSLWDRSSLPRGKKSPGLAGWLQERWCREVRPLLTLLRLTADPDVARQAHDQGVHHRLATHEWSDPERYRWLLSVSKEVCLSKESWLFWQLCETLSRFPTLSAAREALQPVLRLAMGAPLATRDHFLDLFLEVVSDTRQGLRDSLPRLLPYVPRLLRFAEADQSVDCRCRAMIKAALILDRVLPDQAHAWLDWLLSYLNGEGRPDGDDFGQGEAMEVGVPLAVKLAAGDILCFQAIIRAALKNPFEDDGDRIRRSLTLLDRFPALRGPLARLFPRQPRRCVELLVRLGLTTRLPAEVLSPLDALSEGALEGEPWPEEDTATPSWEEILEIGPDLAPMVLAYRQAQRLLGASREVPPGLRRALEQPRKLARELAHLEPMSTSQPDRADLAARVRSLRARLSDKAGLLDGVRRELRERLEHMTAEAQISAAEQQVLACYQSRLETVAGPLPPDLRLDADLLNATLLTVDISQNRRLLQRLLRAHLSGDRGWRERHPANAAFLAALAGRGVDAAAWLAAHPRRYPYSGSPEGSPKRAGWVRLHLERDPVRILQMGNYFGTCLSFGGFNAFSTVTNACELNKRVAYATDAAGRIVGRKLIGINEAGDLVGFHTYASLPDEAGNAALRAIFRHYLGDFAARCGLRLADSGRVPTLFAEHWYDDGTVAWDAEEASLVPVKSRPSHRGR